ncbi:MAG: hypothetical protein ACRDRL_23135, partial [Sciscionella sp.]
MEQADKPPREYTEGRDTDRDWLASVYSDLTLVTQLDGDDTVWTNARNTGGTQGSPTISSSQPTHMAW